MIKWIVGGIGVLLLAVEQAQSFLTNTIPQIPTSIVPIIGITLVAIAVALK